MAMRGVHFAVSDATLAYILALGSSGPVDLISNVIEEGWATDRTCETDKAWGLIHATLQNSNPCSDSLERHFDGPDSWAILGREFLPSPDNFLIALARAEEVSQIAETLEGFSDEEFSRRLKELAGKFECSNIRAVDINYAAKNYAGLRAFYKHAAECSSNVIFTVDW